MKRIRRALAATMLVAATLAAGVAVAPAAEAAGPSTVDIRGRGWGHGRGMSQFGAWGYARDHGWTSDRILDHYYGGTHAAGEGSYDSPVNPGYVRVNLQAVANSSVLVFGVEGGSTLSISGAEGVTIPGDHKAVQLVRNGANWEVYSGGGCGGPWGHRGTASNLVTIGRGTGNDQLMLCQSGKTTWYPGSLRAYTDGSITRAINITTIEEYLRSVVPAEMPASWHGEALEVQAIAARSYAMAGETRSWIVGSSTKYADTCDTTYCQVYAGHAQRIGSGSKVSKTDARTDAAVAATAGVVRAVDGTRRVARTEFASTSGGWTKGGAFPAVEDLGDSISPRHTWAFTKSVTQLENQCGGDFQRLTVTQRNGLGPDGGRVLRADLVCSNRTMSVTGDQIRIWLGLYSDWWSIGGDCADSAPGRYIDAVHQLFLGRAPSSGERASWCDTITAGNLKALTTALSVSDEWAGTRIDDLYRKILDRGPDSKGRADWLAYVRAGNDIEDVAAGFYASSEYYQRAGGTTRGYVESLYTRILGRSADTKGRDDWVRAIDSGSKSRRQVAAGFYDSIESRRQRVTALYQQILLRDPDSSGMKTWTQKLLDYGDIVLSSELARSSEYYNRASRTS